MHRIDLIAYARTYLIFDEDISTANLIRRIQQAQGNPECFATGARSCDQIACRWRADCLPQRDAGTDTTV